MVAAGFRRGAGIAVGELVRATPERRLDCVAKLVEVICGALQCGTVELKLEQAP